MQYNTHKHSTTHTYFHCDSSQVVIRAIKRHEKLPEAGWRNPRYRLFSSRQCLQKARQYFIVVLCLFTLNNHIKPRAQLRTDRQMVIRLTFRKYSIYNYISKYLAKKCKYLFQISALDRTLNFMFATCLII